LSTPTRLSELGAKEQKMEPSLEAAIYCRVSTQDQGKEGTSLDTQLEACKRKALELGYELNKKFFIREVYSGLTLDRPGLTELRSWIRSRAIQAVIAYSTDRLSRDPVHLLLLAEESDKAQVPLVFVTEPLDNSMEGQLLGFVRGWASKLEAVRIKERTVRGKKARALSGRLPANSHAHLYGYAYIPGKGIGQGIRYINETHAKWVREIYRWLVEEGLSTYAITCRLRTLGVPTPSGKGYWIKSTVHHILTNPAYYGKTYAFTQTYGEPKYRLKPNTKRKNSGRQWKPKEDWLEIPNATPPIISEELFQAAQKQLKRNRELSLRNTKIQYLLHGHIYCSKCGRSYWGAPGIKTRNGKRYCYPFYQCSSKYKMVSPVSCGNHRYSAKVIENLVWKRIEMLLSKPEAVFEELKEQQQEAQEASFLVNDLRTIEAKLVHRQKEKQRIWKAFEITGDEETFRRDIALLGEEIKALQEEKLTLERRIETGKQFELDEEKVKEACKLVSENLKTLSFAERRLALEALQIKVWVDRTNIAIQGLISLPEGDIASMPPV
jgi:site-specific DNA recombinase